MASFNLCNLFISLPEGTDVSFLKEVEDYLNNFKTDKNFIIARSIGNIRYLSICYVNSTFFGVYILENGKIITTLDLNEKEVKLFKNSLRILQRQLQSGNHHTSLPEGIVAGWMHHLARDLNKLRMLKVKEYLFAKYGRTDDNFSIVQKELTELSKCAPIPYLLSLYRSDDVNPALASYVTLCLTNEIEPIPDDIHIFS